MNLTLQLSAELEAKLVEQAKALGKAPEELVLQVLEEQLDATPLATVALSPEEWVADFRAWAESHRRLSADFYATCRTMGLGQPNRAPENG